MTYLIIVLFGVLALFFAVYRRKVLADIFLLDYGKRTKELEDSFVSASGQAIESLQQATEELEERIEQANLTISELKEQIQIAEQLLYTKNTQEALQQTHDKAEVFSEYLKPQINQISGLIDKSKYEEIKSKLQEDKPDSLIAEEMGVGLSEVSLVRYMNKHNK